MAWNISSGETAKATKGKSRWPLNTLLLLLLVVVVASGICYFVRDNIPNQGPDEPRRKLIADASNNNRSGRQMDEDVDSSVEIRDTAVNANRHGDGVAKDITNKSNSDLGMVVTNSFGDVFTIEAVVAPRSPRIKGKEIFRDRRLFTSDAENLLDGIMDQPIGDRMLGTIDFEGFEKDFIAAFNNKIEITEEDNDAEVRRKLEMIDLKNDLKEAYENGESIGKIVKEYYDEQSQIAQIRDTLMNQLAEVQQSGADEEEVEELYEVANKLLGEYDALPLVSPRTARFRMREYMLKKENKR